MRLPFFSTNCSRMKINSGGRNCLVVGGPLKAYLCSEVCFCCRRDCRRLVTWAGGRGVGMRVGRVGWGCQHLPGIAYFADAPKMGEIGQSRYIFLVGQN